MCVRVHVHPQFVQALGEWEEASASFSRRVFKTHMVADKVLGFGTGRHIYVCRNPLDTLLSHYQYMTSLTCVDKNILGLENYYFVFFKQLFRPSYWEMLVSWWSCRCAQWG
jgi:hypothetical protein